MARAIALLLVAALAVPACMAASCVQHPLPVGEGQACSGSIPCTQNFFCQSGVCVARLGTGATCVNDDNCESSLRCVGTTSKVCTSLGGVGSHCDDVTAPCADSLACAPIANVCVGGQLGDSCSDSDQVDVCENLKCTSGICQGRMLGQNCSSTDACDIGLFCDATSSTCFSEKTSGRCSIGDECQYGYVCAPLLPTDGVRYCTKRFSRKAGEYCENFDEVCDGSMRCESGYCASSRLDDCLPGDCSYDELCTCDGTSSMGPGDSGFGRCTANKCLKASEAFGECGKTKCGGNYAVFSGSCIGQNCLDEFNAYAECAGAASLSASLALFAVLAAFVQMVVRQ